MLWRGSKSPSYNLSPEGEGLEELLRRWVHRSVTMVIKAFIFCLYVTAVVGTYYSTPEDSPGDVILQLLSKRSAAVLSKFLMQSLRQMDANSRMSPNAAIRRKLLLAGQLNLPERLDGVVNLERREMKPNEAQRKYHRCYFNAVSCF